MNVEKAKEITNFEICSYCSNKSHHIWLTEDKKGETFCQDHFPYGHIELLDKPKFLFSPSQIEIFGDKAKFGIKGSKHGINKQMYEGLLSCIDSYKKSILDERS